MPCQVKARAKELDNIIWLDGYISYRNRFWVHSRIVLPWQIRARAMELDNNQWVGGWLACLIIVSILALACQQVNYRNELECWIGHNMAQYVCTLSGCGGQWKFQGCKLGFFIYQKDVPTSTEQIPVWEKWKPRNNYCSWIENFIFFILFCYS